MAQSRSRGGPTVTPPASSQARGGPGGAVGPPLSSLGIEAARGGVVGLPPPSVALDAELADAFGPLAPYLSLPAVTDVLVAPGGEVWLDEGAGLRRDDVRPLPEAEAQALAVRLIALGGRHLDVASPLGDVRLGSGIRVHAALPPVSVGGTAISIRVPRAAGLSLDELAAAGTATESQRAALAAAVVGRKNLLVTGATGSGKTTLLAALLALAPPGERIVIIEDLAELQVRHPHVVSLEARQANLEGAGEIGLARLVREALRMRPDRLVVGECRGAEIRELFSALNTGHDGGAGTLHASSLADVPARIEALGALAGLGADAVARQAASAIDLVVHVARVEGRRVIAAMGELTADASGRLQVVER
ncbi:TadA family conjugal transfer-associated ATPase [Gryllotalpicola protaetiae]|uniref:TadA family conjugal transfer-associated ATPase n=1 Tax=Gryllotalpicola protaetiae TaxID=2419771 RepID=A0A387BNK6_9MICO|nr:TadA family conjugal transfer-associated ATPase [Gryllotalpicola protaetiae]